MSERGQAVAVELVDVTRVVPLVADGGPRPGRGELFAPSGRDFGCHRRERVG